MPFGNYTELQAAVANELERDDLTSGIVDFVRLAEARIRRDIRVREIIQRDSITVNLRQIPLPDRFLQAIELRLLTDPVTVLEELNLPEMTRVRTSGAGTPTRYTIHTEIEFNKPPGSSIPGEIIFYESVEALQGFDFLDADVSVADDTITETGHGIPDLTRVRLTTTGVLPTGLAADTDYWVIVVDADTISLATSAANALADTAIDITAAAGGGTHTLGMTNVILLEYPDLYFYASLMASATRLMHDERVPLWVQLYGEAKASANKVSQKSRQSGILVSRVVGRGP